jgi:hypothetical protein
VKTIIPISLAFFSVVFLANTLLAESPQQYSKAESIAFFNEAAKVFQHPRCLNCHPAGDQPTQGTDFHLHVMNVQRGKDDHGAVGMRCSTCHGTENNLNSGVPGAPKWALAPRNMAWQGLSKKQLCESLKDPNRTHMTAEEFIKHNAEDELVAWGWKPGPGREPAPGTQKQFGELVAKWIHSGAYCPAD